MTETSGLGLWVELCEVSHQFGDRSVLQHITLSLTERRIGIIGSNGSGKSTFARLLNGLVVPTQGSVQVDGLETRHHLKTVRRRVGFIFQNPDHQIILPTVAEDLAFGLRQFKLSSQEIAHRVNTTLDEYGLTAFREHPAHLLSGGQKQLLAIAAVLITQPRYLVLDEPTTLLDLRNRNRICRLLWALPQPMVVVSHDLQLLREFDRIIVFDGGTVVMDAPPAIALPAYIEQMSC
jgi:biotin transport system ATP-binding protein